jgi:hypothetical protein
MKRRRRELVVFSLSALDVLAMSTGVFVLLLVMVMPYFRKHFEVEAEIAQAQAQSAELAARAEATRETSKEAEAEADRLAAEAARAAGEAQAMERETAARLALIKARSQPTPPRAPPPVPTPPTPQPVAPPSPAVDALDLIFVVDTTASMTPAVQEMAASMRSIARILERLVGSVRIGVVAYKDRDTGLPPVDVFPLTPTQPGLNRILAYMDRMDASPVGSRTVEEDVYLALQAAVALPLRPEAKQTLVLMGDAPPHPEERDATLYVIRSFVGRSDRRTVSALFVSTPSSVRRGQIDRGFFQDAARAGGGAFNDHAGSMIESVLLSVLVE